MAGLFGSTISNAEKRANFRKSIESGSITTLPGAFNPLTARLIQDIGGFDGVYVSGAVLANDLGNFIIGRQCRTDRVIREENENWIGVTELGGLCFGAQDSGDCGGDDHGNAKLKAQALGDVDVFPAQVARSNAVLVVHGARGGDADGNQLAIEAGHQAVDARHDVLNEVFFAQLRHWGRDVVFADRAAHRVIKADVGLGGTHRNAGENPVILGDLKGNGGAAAAA